MTITKEMVEVVKNTNLSTEELSKLSNIVKDGLIDEYPGIKPYCFINSSHPKLRLEREEMIKRFGEKAFLSMYRKIEGIRYAILDNQDRFKEHAWELIDDTCLDPSTESNIAPFWKGIYLRYKKENSKIGAYTVWLDVFIHPVVLKDENTGLTELAVGVYRDLCCGVETIERGFIVRLNV